jgi:hypothetical protein
MFLFAEHPPSSIMRAELGGGFCHHIFLERSVLSWRRADPAAELDLLIRGILRSDSLETRARAIKEPSFEYCGFRIRVARPNL